MLDSSGGGGASENPRHPRPAEGREGPRPRKSVRSAVCRRANPERQLKIIPAAGAYLRQKEGVSNTMKDSISSRPSSIAAVQTQV